MRPLVQKRFSSPAPEPETKRGKAAIQEEKGADRYGGRVKPGSGSTATSKADVQTRSFLIEMKGTIHGSISVKGEWLTKISHEALYEGRYPALEIKIDQIAPPVEDTWVLVPASVFAELNEQANIKRKS